ncbi:MAG: YhcH/YjgK/YiaL family protein [Lachnospiraceae bacterium]|nr:YhcH/YjgK/YiaL family protein [Lachnospiraceae bacterium]
MIFFHEKEAGEQTDAIQKCMAFLHSDTFPTEGGTAEVGSGIRCIVSEYTTQPEKDAFWEAHKQYVDLHYILSGEEKIRILHTSQGKLGKYHTETDYQEVEGKAMAEVVLKEGFALCLFPSDAHQVKLQVCRGEEVPVTKVVFKIPIELF